MAESDWVDDDSNWVDDSPNIDIEALRAAEISKNWGSPAVKSTLDRGMSELGTTIFERPRAATRAAGMELMPAVGAMMRMNPLTGLGQMPSQQDLSTITRQVPSALEAGIRGWQDPESVKSMASDLPTPNPELPEPILNALMTGKIVAGAGLDILADPWNAAPVPFIGPAGKAIGQGMVRAAERGIPVVGPASKWFGKQVARISPEFAGRVSPAGLSEAAATKEREARRALQAFQPQVEQAPAAQIPPQTAPFTPWEGIDQVVPNKFSPWDDIGKASPEQLAPVVEPPVVQAPVEVPVAQRPVQGPADLVQRPPVIGANNQYELNFGQSLEGRSPEAFPVPAPLPPRQFPKRSKARQARVEARRTFQGQPDGEQLELDLRNYPEDLFPGQGVGKAPDQGPLLGEMQGPARNQGQQEFDFTKGPVEEPRVEAAGPIPGVPAAPTPAPTPKPLSLQERMAAKDAEREAAIRARVEAARKAGQIKVEAPDPRLATAEPKNIIEESAAPDLPEEIDPVLAQAPEGDVDQIARIGKEIAAPQSEDVLRNPRHVSQNPKVQRWEEELARLGARAHHLGNPKESARLQSVIESVIDEDGLLREGVTPEQAVRAMRLGVMKAPKQASAFEDVLSVLRTKAGMSVQDPKVIAEAEAAMKRLVEDHAPRLAAHLRTPGETASSYVAKHFGDLDRQWQQKLVKEFQKQRPKMGNVYADKLSSDVRKIAETAPEVMERPVVSDKEVAKFGTKEEVARMAEDIASEDPRTRAAVVRHVENMAAVFADLAKKTPQKAEQYRQEVIEYLRILSKARHSAGLVLRHAGQKGASSDFMQNLETALAAGEYTGADADIIREAVSRYKKLNPTVAKMVNNGVQEFGINMMLFNTDTSARNVIGGMIGVLLNPVARTGNAFATAGARALGVEPKSPTEFAEIGPSIAAGVKAVPKAVKSGLKMFLHETPKGVAESYAKQAKKFKKTLPREEAKAKIRELQSKKRDVQQSFEMQEDLSSLGISTDRALRAKNLVLDKAGKLFNAPVRALKAQDLVNSQIIKEMETTAAIIRKTVENKRKGIGGTVKLTAADKDKVYDQVLYYTMRQKLPKELSSIYKAINSNAITGLTLPFMRAQIALPRFALNWSPGAALSIGKNILKTAQGKDQLDTMQITRAALGTAMTAAAWAKMKADGVEIHGAALTPDEQVRRKAAGTPPGIYLKFKDGSTKRVDDIAPVSYIFAALAAFDDADRRLADGQPVDENNMTKGAEAIQNILNGSVFTSTRDVVEAVSAAAEDLQAGGRTVYPGVNEGETLDRAPGKRFLDKKIVSVTAPRFLAEAQRKGWGKERDSVYRAPRGLGEEYKVAIGLGLQKDVPEQIGAFGAPLERGEGTPPLEEIFGLGKMPNQDPAVKLFDELGWYPTPPAKTVDGLRVSQEKRMEQLKKFGPAVHKMATKLAMNEQFRAKPKSVQLAVVKQMVSSIMSGAGVMTKGKMQQQVKRMSPEQKDAMRYKVREKDPFKIAEWGL